MLYSRRKRVRLTCDLTSYCSGLTAGSLGWTMPDAYAQWGVMVAYDNGAQLDTLWKSLEHLEDETMAATIEEAQRSFRSEAKDLLEAGVDANELRGVITEINKEVKKDQRKKANKALKEAAKACQSTSTR